MNFQNLHELLRLEVLRRVDRGMLTGTGLARQTGFKQGHISNFLRGKRSLSLEGLDRVLAAQELTVDELMPHGSSAGQGFEISAGAAPEIPIPISTRDAIERIPVVSPSAAANEAVVRAASVLETVPVAAGRLDDSRTAPSPRRAGWQRFVAIRAGGAEAAAMDPVIQPGSIVVLDRHYVSPAPYRAQQRTLYAVRGGSGLTLRYVEFDAGVLLLRPLSPDYPVQVVPLAAHETPADYLIGRVCLVLSEL